MTNGGESRAKRRQTWWAILAALVVLIVAVVVPPMVSVNRYKGQITQLISQTFGRPVRFSAVNVRLLPWPGFEVDDLSVAEDPAYGAEPVLHATTVTASIRLLALWRGRLEIGKIKVDDASLNIVRTAPGAWNIDALFRNTATQAAQAGSAQNNAAPLPTLVATNSRIDFKSGVEKLPFSLLNADLTLSQDSPGNWRVRLRGQPARTDVSLFQEDTGVVRLEATLHHAPALRQMPVHLDLDWREAQIGQLARLVTGSDPGWRGDLTGELHLDGTAESAQTTVRLRAEGVHRAEFVPASTMDFDANCSLVVHYTVRSLENLACNSPLGDGHIQITGDQLGGSAPSHVTVALDRIPVAAGLDALRTLRSGIQPELQASGTVSGKIDYASDAPAPAVPSKPSRSHPAKVPGAAPGPLTGSLTVDHFALSGGGLSTPVSVAKITFAPGSPAGAGAPPGLTGTASIPAGGTTPLSVAARLTAAGYQVALRGPASIPRARELAHAAGIPGADPFDSLAGDPLVVDIQAAGPWMPAESILPPLAPLPSLPSAKGLTQPEPVFDDALPTADILNGTVMLRNANWKADYLASHLEISQATLHLAQGIVRWDPIEFTYGPVKGTATLEIPPACQPDSSPQPCPLQPIPSFTVQFGQLDLAALQTALLGAQQQGTMLSSLIDRLHPASAASWPRAEGTVSADALVLDPVTLTKFTADVELSTTEAYLTDIDASLLEGQLHAAGSAVRPATDRDKPEYEFEGDFKKIDSASLGHLLGLRWIGGPVNGSGKITLSGYAASDLAASAAGTLHLEAARGSIATSLAASASDQPPAALSHFDRFTADAEIAKGAIHLGQNQVISGSRKQSVSATVTFATPPAVSFTDIRAASSQKTADAPPKRGFR